MGRATEARRGFVEGLVGGGTIVIFVVLLRGLLILVSKAMQAFDRLVG